MNQMRTITPQAEISPFNPAFSPSVMDFLAQNRIADPTDPNRFAAVNQAFQPIGREVPSVNANGPLSVDFEFSLPEIAQQASQGEEAHKWAAERSRSMDRQKRIQGFAAIIGAYYMAKMQQEKLMLKQLEDSSEEEESEDGTDHSIFSTLKKRKSFYGLAA